MNKEFDERETAFVIDGLVYLISQAERELDEFEKLKDESLREDVCKYQVGKIRSLRTLTHKLRIKSKLRL